MQWCFRDASVLWDGDLQTRDFCWQEAIITGENFGHFVDLSGFMVFPGFVDVHGDGFEHHLAKRRGVLKDIQFGFHAAHNELASNGITTAVLAQFFSWEGGMRGPEFAAHFLPGLQRFQDRVPTTLMPQLRFEIHMREAYEQFYNLVRDYNVPYVVFNDHLPHEALRKGKKPPRLNGQALKAKRSPDQHLELLQRYHASHLDVMADLPRFAARLRELGCLLGSHDDHTAEDRGFFYQMGAVISEFPETIEAARAAQGPVFMGAPNFVRGGSHKDNVSASDLVDQGLVTALASDYHYPSLWLATQDIARTKGWAHAFDLVARGPARALGLNDRGYLLEGARADFIVVHAETHTIQGTFAAGQPTFATAEFAQRLLSIA